ncbi:hypothetical protein [Streptomyces sp. NPDC001139]
MHDQLRRPKSEFANCVPKYRQLSQGRLRDFGVRLRAVRRFLGHLRHEAARDPVADAGLFQATAEADVTGGARTRGARA